MNGRDSVMNENNSQQSFSLEILKFGVPAIVSLFLASTTDFLKTFPSWSLFTQVLLEAFILILWISFETRFFTSNIFLSENKASARGFVATSLILCIFGSVKTYYNDILVNRIFADGEKRIKILVLPFLSGKNTAGDKRETGLDIENFIRQKINEDNLNDKIVVKYFDESEPGKNRNIYKRYYRDELYVANIMKKTHADMIVYGEGDMCEMITYNWQTSDRIRKYLDTSIERGALIKRKGYQTSSFDDLAKGRVEGCPQFIIAFVALKLNYLANSYTNALAHFEKIIEFEKCSTPSAAKASYFVATQCAMKLWDDRWISKLDQYKTHLFEVMKFTEEDLATLEVLTAWVYFNGSNNLAGLACADSAVAHFERLTIRDTTSYLKAKILQSIGLSNIGRYRDAIRLSEGIIEVCKRYPELQSINYCNIGAYFANYYLPGKDLIDSSLYYLLLAASNNPKNSIHYSKDLEYNILVNLAVSLGQTCLPRSGSKDVRYILINKGLELCRKKIATFPLSEVDPQNHKALVKQIHDSVANAMNAVAANVKCTSKEEKVLVERGLHYLDSLLSLSKPNSDLMLQLQFELATFYFKVNYDFDKAINHAQHALRISKLNPFCSYSMEAGAYNVLSRIYLEAAQKNKIDRSFKDSCIKYSDLGIVFCNSLLDDKYVRLFTIPNLEKNKAEAIKLNNMESSRVQ